MLEAAKMGGFRKNGFNESLQRIARTKAIVEPPLPLDLDRFNSLCRRNIKLNSKLNYVYGGTIK